MARKFMSKSQIAEKLGISNNTLRIYLNVRYFEELEPLGYVKNSRILSPRVIRLLKMKLVFFESGVNE